MTVSVCYKEEPFQSVPILGRISIENANLPANKRDPKRRRSPSGVDPQTSLIRYHESAVSQMPQYPCYGFELNDKGWRVELEVWSEDCEENQEQLNTVKLPQQYRTFLQLETPLPK